MQKANTPDPCSLASCISTPLRTHKKHTLSGLHTSLLTCVCLTFLEPHTFSTASPCRAPALHNTHESSAIKSGGSISSAKPNFSCETET